jgi:H+/Cl- antiporter ClcA
VISLVLLPPVLFARYARTCAASGGPVYVVGAVLVLYLNVFVLVVQLFRRVPGLIVTAPTQKEPPFVVSQLILLGLFVVLGIAAARRFRPTAGPEPR